MKILLATDGSESARATVDCLLSFPFPDNSEVTVLTVIDKDVFKHADVSSRNGEQQNALKETEKILQDAAQELLAQETARLREAGWSESSELRVGYPAEEIVRVAKRLGSDCIIVGSHGMSGIKRFLLGSVSDHVLQYAPCSVLIVKKHDQHCAGSGKPLRMLLSYDDSEPARRAVEFCASLPLGDQTEVTALSVLPLVTLYRQDIRQRLSWLWQEKKKHAEAALEEVAKKIARTTAHVDTQLREAPDVSDEILHAATELDSDLIVLGHKGRGAIKAFLLGSTTSRIAHHADCSVLAIRNY